MVRAFTGTALACRSPTAVHAAP